MPNAPDSPLSTKTKTAAHDLPDDLKRLEERAFKLASRLHAEVGLSADAINQAKQAMKFAGRARQSGLESRMRAARTRILELTAFLETELEQAALEVPDEVRSIPGGTGPSERRARPPAPDELQGTALSDVSTKVSICMQMARGLSAREAIDRLGVDATPRWARKIYQAYRERGATGLYDGRSMNGREETVMSEEVKTLALRLWLDHRSATQKEIHRLVREHLRERIQAGELPVDTRIPSYASIRRFFWTQPETMKLIRRGDMEEYRKHGRSMIPIEWTRHANERWQADGTTLDIWAKRLNKRGEWEPSKVYIAAAIDVHSRAIASFIVHSAPATGALIRRLFLTAILPNEGPTEVHGLPDVIQTDNGPEYAAEEVRVGLAALKVRQDFDPGEYPERKGRIERWFRTLDEGLLRTLPGHKLSVGTSEGAAEKNVEDFLTVDQIRQEIAIWVREEYHNRIHTSIQARPIQEWHHTVRLREPESEEQLLGLWVNATETRKITEEGVRLTIDGTTRRYWAPGCDPRIGEEVRVGYNSEEPYRVLLYSLVTGERYGWAYDRLSDETPYDFTHVIRARRKTEGALRQRLERYRTLNETERRETRARDPEMIEALRRDLTDAGPDDEISEEAPLDSVDALEAELRAGLMIMEED